ncbi:MAG: substrate-binding domain-containing protein [Hespellia sp.]|nr:substrate-binding domain-containing protein [Hespellia sp.]
MKKRVTWVDGITMLLLAVMCATIIGAAVLCGGCTVKADSGTDIIPYTREDGSGTRGAFISMTGLEKRNFLGELMDDTAEDIAVIGSSEEMMIQVANTQNGLGYVSYAVAKDSDAVKMLKVDGVLPTIDHIKNETYPLIRTFQLVYQGPLTDIEKDFLQYVKSEGQGYIAEYCVPARNEGIFLPNGAVGKLVVSGSTSMTPMMRALAEGYMQANPNAKVEVKSSDSEAGMMDVLDGSSNFGMVSRDLKSYEKTLLDSERVGRDAIAIIVNQENEVDGVSTSQLKKIYNGSLTSWEYLNVYE